MKVVLASLMVALIASNAWWTFEVLDQGVSLTYLRQSYEEQERALRQALSIVVAARGKLTREEIVNAAGRDLANKKPLEKDGETVIGNLAFRFDEAGRLINVEPTP